jgi:hypothetical protein
MVDLRRLRRTTAVDLAVVESRSTKFSTAVDLDLLC